MSFSLSTMTPRFPKLPQIAGKKCLQPTLSFTLGSNSLSVTFLFFCKYFYTFLQTNKISAEFSSNALNLYSLWQAQTDPPPVLPPAQKRPFGGPTLLPCGHCPVLGSPGPADGVWGLHARGSTPHTFLFSGFSLFWLFTTLYINSEVIETMAEQTCRQPKCV